MTARPLILIGGVTVLAVGAMIAISLFLTPDSTNPAYAAAVDFMNAAGSSDDVSAFALLSDEMQAYIGANCPEESVSACIDAYTPPEWGGLLTAVFRRAIPDGRAFDILLFATYQEGVGFSGVCIYHRVEEVAEDDWRVTAWAGFLHCEEPDASIQRLREADAVNRAP